VHQPGRLYGAEDSPPPAPGCEANAFGVEQNGSRQLEIVACKESTPVQLRRAREYARTWRVRIQQPAHFVHRTASLRGCACIWYVLVSRDGGPERAARAEHSAAQSRRAFGTRHWLKFAHVQQRLVDAGQSGCIAHASLLSAQRFHNDAPGASLQLMGETDESLEEFRDSAFSVGQIIQTDAPRIGSKKRSDVNAA
jgi:hypothetical protein